MLPPRLRSAASDRARAQRISFGELVRRVLEREIAAHSPKKNNKVRDSFLDDRAVFRGHAPEDLAANHDASLYRRRQ
jgi:hypothetical protein